MRHTQPHRAQKRGPRGLVLVLALCGALMACTLSFNTEPDDPAQSAANVGGGTSDAGVAPVARIVDPVSGVTVPANQRVDLTVQTDTTATRFQLAVGGQVVSTKSLPADQFGPTSAILSWTPQNQGSYTLEVVAYNNALPGPPAALLLTVSGTAANTDASSGTATSCTGRAVVSQLNFRDGPGTSNNKLGQFQTGETVTVLGRNTDNSWYKVRRALNAEEVWVINNPQWFQTEGNCVDLAVLN